MKFYVEEFGAKADGETKDTEAIQAAIDRCFQEGGGKVILERGTYVSGTLYLKSGVYLEIAPCAVLMASPDIEDYGDDTHHNRYRNETGLDRCFIYAQDAENIGLTGYGEINGNADAFPNGGSIYRPMMIRLLRCKNVRLENLKLYNSAAWTTAFLDSQFIWIKGVNIWNEKKYNGDGLDFDGSSHVWVSDCFMKGTDDNLCLQSSSRAFPVEEIHITNCSFTSTCAAVRIGLKSVGTIRNVVISNCTMKNVYREGIKIECTEGGDITDILIQNIAMYSVRRPVFIILNNRFELEGYGTSVELKEIPAIGTMKRIMISNITAVDGDEMKKINYRFSGDAMGSPKFNGIRVDANDAYPIEEMTLDHIRYQSAGGVKKEEIPAFYPPVVDRLTQPEAESSENYYPDWSRAAFMDIRNVRGLELNRIVLSSEKADEREPYIIENCEVVRQDIKYQE
ncbi:glycosyl hydrolase family 28 [Hungatella effluvii]|uniref:Glycosyl hydrolase family 28 n=1 Tax=Hungatella effluvii TaxID=1096246 RepID=A0A2V3YCB7_9FIRM|nr:glycosyl hydrolase family 28 protein [Hungatella effluvii]PXX57088.1 glycosyl hydrolase family 28 [Hungatella effluvii]